MDVVVRSRHCELTDQFREHVEEKLGRLEKHDHRVIRIEVEVDMEKNPRLSDRAVRVELTAFSKGPLLRSEGAAEEKLAAFEIALDRMATQMRRAADRRRVHRGRHAPVSVSQALAPSASNGDAAPDEARETDDVSPPVVEEQTKYAARDLGPESYRRWCLCAANLPSGLARTCHDQVVSTPQTLSRASDAHIRVLVVDDQELFRRGLTMLLNVEDDIEVVGEAIDGNSAASLATESAPDVVLMDVRMPKLSGIEACTAIKDAAPNARIIMLTVSDDEADLYEAVKNGASGYLLKDSSIEEVAQAVRVVADGQSLISPSMAIKLLDEFKQMSRADRSAVPSPRLTERELEVLRLVAQGLNNREIAKQLFISENTVKNHVRNILEKLQLHSRMEAVMYAVREKLLDIP
jgi:two-component system NarL family response regulator